ncbi:chorismate mutase [Anianabacter salinae]|uniref:chorismate mutase n=1 Tax=Anianabacter salinae TaxID=2851023 RepID=UPI00225E0339|nr:chorismate mutase [Anianabacter salinae]MBV0911262.1 chorismate mutase [Anianabacter salinae]
MPQTDPDNIETMADLRTAIDAVDDRLMALLAERLRLTDLAPTLKQREGISAAAPSRVAEVLSRVRGKADEMGFDPGLAEAMWRRMIETVIAREERVMGKKGQDR